MIRGDVRITLCPRCQKRLRVSAHLAGQRVRCPNSSCSISFLVPEKEDVDVPAPGVRATGASAPHPEDGVLNGHYLLKAIERMAADARKERVKNGVVGLLKYFRVLAIVAFVVGFIFVKAASRGEAPVLGIGIGIMVLAVIVEIILEVVAYCMGRLSTCKARYWL